MKLLDVETAFPALISMALSGGPHAISAILVIFIILLLIDRKRMIKQIEEKEQKLDKVLEDYYKGNVTLAEALTSLKLVLAELRGRMS